MMCRIITTAAEPCRALAALFGGVLLPLGLFGALAEDVWQREGFGWDVAILRFVHSYASTARDALMIVVSHIGGAAGMIPLGTALLVALLARKRGTEALFVGLAYSGAPALH